MPRKMRSILEQQGKDTSRLFQLGTLALTSRLSSRRPLMNQNILLKGTDWDIRFDLGSEPLQFPTEVAAITLRPDVVIYSRTEKIVIMLELTVPLEDRSHLAHDRRTSKYAPLPAPVRRMASQPMSLLWK